MRRPPKLCNKKPCRNERKQKVDTLSYLTTLRLEVSKLQEQLKEKSQLSNMTRDHLMARTELIKAMGWAMKTCSSALWSDRKSSWMDERR